MIFIFILLYWIFIIPFLLFHPYIVRVIIYPHCRYLFWPPLPHFYFLLFHYFGFFYPLFFPLYWVIIIHTILGYFYYAGYTNPYSIYCHFYYLNSIPPFRILNLFHSYYSYSFLLFLFSISLFSYQN